MSNGEPPGSIGRWRPALEGKRREERNDVIGVYDVCSRKAVEAGRPRLAYRPLL